MSLAAGGRIILTGRSGVSGKPARPPPAPDF